MLLINAARDGDTETVRTLLSSAEVQSFINYQDASGASPLHIAAARGHAAVAKQLISAHCNIHLQRTPGSTPLYKAGSALQGWTDAHKDGYTPLFIAAANGHASVTKQLIEARFNIDLLDKYGYTAAAQRRQQWTCVRHETADSSSL